MNIQKENAMQQIRNLFDDLSKVVLHQLDLLEKIINGSMTIIPEDILKELNDNEERIDNYEISISEEISPNKLKKVVAIEIKGGTDKSNIWNRLGEAELAITWIKNRQMRINETA